jgi:hypothetical protein
MAMVVKAVEGELVSNSPMQRVSIYVDDVVLYFRPATHELTVIKQLPNMFGEASGLHVNYPKTTVP